MDIETIRIAFEENEVEILSVTLTSQPFKIGECVFLQVENKEKNKWDVEDFDLAEFEIISIWSTITLAYVSRIHQHVSYFINVKRVPEPPKE